MRIVDGGYGLGFDSRWKMRGDKPRRVGFLEFGDRGGCVKRWVGVRVLNHSE
jgi:hypothetical protein